MTNKPKRIHFIGVAGSLIAPLAVAMKNWGWRVTGSDMAFYPPASTFLEDNGVEIIPGFKPSKFEKIGKPDLAMMMSFLTPENPEIKYMIENNVELISLGQLIERYFIKEKSVVVTGNFGKTTIASLIAWILETAGYDPTVLGGGYIRNFGGGVKIGNGDWGVTEGDEFKNWDISRDYQFNRKSRMLYQKPTHVIFTDATWDHFDQYPTEDEYLNNFITLIEQVPPDGFVVGNAAGKNVEKVLSHSKSATKLVGLPDSDITYTESGSEFVLEGESWQTPMLGPIGAQNTALAISLALEIGVKPNDIKKGLASYKGVKRRQEVRFQNDKVTVIDDFAHSPVKLRGLINALRLHHPSDKIILLYQPGNKDREALSKYSADTFAGIDYLLLPRVSSIGKESRHFNKELAEKLIGTVSMSRLTYIDDDAKAVERLVEKTKEYTSSGMRTLIVFAAQKGFRGMIEHTIEQLKSAYSCKSTNSWI